MGARILIKVRKGQVWTSPSDGQSYSISSVKENIAYYIGFGGEEVPFASDLDEDQMTNIDGWQVQEPPEDVSTPIRAQSSQAFSTLDFFKSVPKGYCACNIPKESCEYHKN